jgi:anaerobic glycerol-3-phosphate dehydrogenase
MSTSPMQGYRALLPTLPPSVAFSRVVDHVHVRCKYAASREETDGSAVLLQDSKKGDVLEVHRETMDGPHETIRLIVL